MKEEKSRAIAKTRMGNDALGAILGGGAVATNTPPAVAPSDTANTAPKLSERRPKPAGAPAAPRKVRATFHVYDDLLDSAKDAIVALSGPPLRLTQFAFMDTAIRNEIERLQREHHKNKAFPPRDGDLRVGRPLASRTAG